MGRAASAIVVALTIAYAAPVAADDSERAAELYELGMRLFQAKQYAEASELFAESYKLDPLPAALFNQARCLEESGQHAAAATAFRAYLEADPDGAGAREAEARLLALERRLERARREAAEKEASREVAETASRPDRRRFVEVDRGRDLRIAGYATAGGGVAATIAGVLFGARARRLGEELETPKSEWNDADVEKFEDGLFAERMQIGLLIGGSAAIVTGAVLAVIGHQRVDVVEVGPDGASVTMRF